MSEYIERGALMKFFEHQYCEPCREHGEDGAGIVCRACVVAYAREAIEDAPVVCVETGELFECIRAGADAKGINTAHNIGRSCKRGDRCGGFHWRYYEDSNSSN